MNEPYSYLVKVTLVSGLLYSIYGIFLQRTTFHQLNRFLLLFIIMFSLVCPLLHFNITEAYDLGLNDDWFNDVKNYADGKTFQTQVHQPKHLFQMSDLVLLGYFMGVMVFLVRSVRQFQSVFRLKKRAITLIKKNRTVFVYSDEIKTPFSFFNWIFLPLKDRNIDYANSSILQHEKTHSVQWHSIDLVLSEVYCIVFWFNPFAYLLQKSLKNVHEYIADNFVMRSNRTTLEEYLKLLVTEMEWNISYGITNNFKSMTIKKRIDMITKRTHSFWHSIFYLLLIPAVILMIQSFSMNPGADEIPSIRPVKGGKITVRFGYSGINPVTKKHYTHGGTDIKAEEGTKVMSSANGIVIEAAEKEGWGNVIVIKHGEQYESWYAHLKNFNVKKGDLVNEGQVIGFVGNTGRSTAPHLHYEVRKNRVRVDPEDYFIVRHSED